MIVELRNCSLEIGHIGTREDIGWQIRQELMQAAIGAAMGLVRRIFDAIAEAAIRVSQVLQEFVEKLLENSNRLKAEVMFADYRS